MNKFGFLNADDFKRWIKKNHNEEAVKETNLIGTTVESKYSGKKIAKNMTLETGSAGKVIREFVQFGGVIKEIDGSEYLIEVESGSFFTNKRNVIV